MEDLIIYIENNKKYIKKSLLFDFSGGVDIKDFMILHYPARFPNSSRKLVFFKNEEVKLCKDDKDLLYKKCIKLLTTTKKK